MIFSEAALGNVNECFVITSVNIYRLNTSVMWKLVTNKSTSNHLCDFHVSF